MLRDEVGTLEQPSQYLWRRLARGRDNRSSIRSSIHGFLHAAVAERPDAILRGAERQLEVLRKTEKSLPRSDRGLRLRAIPRVTETRDILRAKEKMSAVRRPF